ncbi:MAG: hypothetical protein EAZ92_00340 [Candidatus Kapaibacterium sp.]|nr:MAG: hypothetical protein EAZ92_00340 [Candidatus Kapabacteria bacterium]
MKIKTFLVSFIVALALVVNAHAQKWEQVGKKGDWSNTVEVLGMDGFIYSIEKNGTLYKTDKNGKYEQIGAAGEFSNVDNFAALDGWLWTVEGGVLYKSNPKSGRWEKVSTDYGDTEAMVGLNGMIYTIESDGTVYETDKQGNYRRLGDKGDFRNTKLFEGMDGFLWTVEQGALYKTNPRSMRWETVDKSGWEQTVALVGANGMLWSVERDGTLHKTNTKTGAEEQVGPKGSMSNVDDMFALDGYLYCIEAGTLWRLKM